jgi:hypothetical protein
LIVFLVTPEHPYTLEEVTPRYPGVTVLTYDQLFGRADVSLPRATYVFSDLDRLARWRLVTVAGLYRQLRGAGLKVLNDPARSLSRFGLLRRLHDTGVNDFNAYRVEDGVMPAKWPVLLRQEGDHNGPYPELLHSPADVERVVERLTAGGIPVSNMLLVEYCAEPVIPGLFRKLSMFRIGEAYFAANCVHEESWVIKHGAKGIATPELYDDDFRIVRDNPYLDAIRPAFELAHVEYGRLDFALVGGRPQVYEINLNPHVGFGGEHPSPARAASFPIFEKNFVDALAAIDTPVAAAAAR